MKLHLPSRLRRALLACLAATLSVTIYATPSADAATKTFTASRNIEDSDWESNPSTEGGGRVLRLKDKFGISLRMGSNVSWTIRFWTTNNDSRTAARLGSLPGATRPDDENDFLVRIESLFQDDNTDSSRVYNGYGIYVYGFGWFTRTGAPEQPTEVRFEEDPPATVFELQYRTATRPGGVVGLFSNPAAGELDQNLQQFSDVCPRTDPLDNLYANSRIHVSYVSQTQILTQVDHLYTVGGAGELGEIGLYTVYSDDGTTETPITLNTDERSHVTELFAQSGGGNKLRFAAAGEQTVRAVGEDFEIQTVGEGGAVTVSGDFYTAGLRVETGATGYSLTANDGGTIHFADGAGLDIAESFTVGDSISWDSAATISVASSKVLTLNGAGSGSGYITLDGEGTVRVNSANVLGEGTVNVTSGTLDLNHYAMTNHLVLSGGSLANAEHCAGENGVDVSTLAGGSGRVIKLGGLSADQLNVYSLLGPGDRVEGIGSGTLDLSTGAHTFNLSKDFFSSSVNASGKHYVLEFAGEGTVQLPVAGDNKITFQIGDDVLRDCTGTYYLWFTNAKLLGLETTASPESITEWLNDRFTFGEGDGSAVEIIVESSGQGIGKLKALISADGIWYASKHGADINRTDLITWSDPKWKQIVVDTDMTIHIDKADEELTLTNVRTGNSGIGTGKLTVTNAGSAEHTLTLEYTENQVFDNDIEIQGSNTKIEKSGNRSLTVTGNLTSGGVVHVASGQLTLNGANNRAGQVSMAADGSIVLTGKLTLDGTGGTTTQLTSGSLSGTGELVLGDKKTAKVTGDVVARDNKLVVNVEGDGAAFTANGSMELGGLKGSGKGTLNLSDGTTVTLTGKGGELTYHGAISGTGDITLRGSSTRQALYSRGNGDTDLKVEENAALAILGDGEISNHMQTARYKNLTVGEGANLFVIASELGSGKAAGTQMQTKGDIAFEGGSCTEFRYNFAGANDHLQSEKVGPLVKSDGTITIGSGAEFVLSNVGSMFDVRRAEDLEDLVLMQGASINYLGGAQDTEGPQDVTSLFKKSGAFLVYYSDLSAKLMDNNRIVFSAKARTGNIFSTVALGSPNAQAAADMLWNSRYAPIALDMTSTLYGVMSSIVNTMFDNPKGLDKTLAAVAGSSVPVLGTAQRDALRAQMTRMRDHAGVMGLNDAYTYESLPYKHFWVEAEGDFANVQDDGCAPGYTYNAWGATAGLELDVNEVTSVAAGITALYGDLDADCADVADGKLDSYYLNVMGHFSKKRWGHTVVGVLGLNQAKLNRTVNYGGSASYRTHGSTSGWVSGLLYEATYDIPVNEQKTRVLQPLVGASIMKTSMRGYSETGQEGQGVGLNVQSQDWLTATFAAGARYITSIGESFFNRVAQAELRANIAQDMGDSQGEAHVALQANPDFASSVHAAEIGKTALQLGAALRVPVTDTSLIYFNAAADFRSGMNAWNFGVGAKCNF